MVSPESIRMLCVQTVRTQGEVFDLRLMELVGQIAEYFEEGKSNVDTLAMIRSMADRPTDA